MLSRSSPPLSVYAPLALIDMSKFDPKKKSGSQSDKPTTSPRVLELITRSEDLESQLTNLHKAEEEKAARLRSHLCEVLSDILISDPVTGQENDCTGRLWRFCFYSPIASWRKKVSREKRRQEKSSVKALSLNFKKFLGEVVTLYDYLVVQYQSKLIPDISQDVSQKSTPDLLNSPAETLQAVVQILVRLYLNMGDLHRYAESFDKAEGCYQNASKLAPGLGNPYNQLAVVSQMKDSNLTCVALYYYARSLLATHDSFETSGSNLDRLFSVNRVFLNEHARDDVPPVLPPPVTKSSTDSHMLRAQKIAASKMCLAFFVDIHHDYSKMGKMLDDRSQVKLAEKTTGFINSFNSLLRASAFSDSLLTKMVLINIFTVEKSNDSQNCTGNRLSLEFLFSFGTSLASRLSYSITKVLERKKPGKFPSSIRILFPFAILCEFIWYHGFHGKSPYMSKFWRELATTGNLLRQVQRDQKDISPKQAMHRTTGKEYQWLKGYKPLNFMFPSYQIGTPYINPAEAVEVLNLSPSPSPQNTNTGVPLEYIDRVIEICDLFSARSDIPIRIVGEEYSCLDYSEELDESRNPKFETIGLDDDDDDDDGGDVVNSTRVIEDLPLPALAYRTRNPDAHHGNTSEKNHLPVFNEVTDTSVPTAAIQMLQPALAPPFPAGLQGQSGVNPPPGFDIPPVSNMNSRLLQSVQTPSSERLCTVPVPINPMASGHMPAPSDCAIIDRPMNIFGTPSSLSTSNPFVLTDRLAPEHTSDPSSWHNYDQFATSDGSELLGSGLLDILWMNDSPDSRTRNPFVQ